MLEDLPRPPLPLWLNPLLQRLEPPAWLQQEAVNRVILALNHVLQEEPEAMQRLRRCSGQVFWVEGQVLGKAVSLALQSSDAGLLEIAPEGRVPALRLKLAESNPIELIQVALAGRKPAVLIEGDVQLAAEINWLVEHVRWDVEADLARVLGDEVSYTVLNSGKSLVSALQGFLQRNGWPLSKGVA